MRASSDPTIQRQINKVSACTTCSLIPESERQRFIRSWMIFEYRAAARVPAFSRV
jgi:hypothetical protein